MFEPPDIYMRRRRRSKREYEEEDYNDYDDAAQYGGNNVLSVCFFSLDGP